MSRTSPGLSYLVILCLLCSCNDEPPLCPPEEAPATVRLQALDIGVTDLFLRVTVADTNQYDSLILSIDGITRFRLSFEAVDTVLFIDSLLPKQRYALRAEIYLDTLKIARSNTLTFATMDTTTHDFTWQVDTLGDGGNSVLYDVAIVSDTSLWVVGELHKRDSLGRWERPYNAAHWDGRNWSLQRVTVRLDYGGGSVIISDQSQLRSVYAASPNDIWFVSSVGGVTRLRNDTTWELMQHQLIDGPGGAKKIWGTGSENLYFVSANGRITHWDGQSWEVMPSGTDVDLLDVWGSPDGSLVWACGWEDFKPTVLLRLQNGVWKKNWEENNPFTIREDSLSGILSSIWTSDEKRLFIASHHGLYKTLSETRGRADRTSFVQSYLPGFPTRLRGSNVNDVTLVGHYTMLAHFNGYTWRYFQEFYDPNIHLFSVDQKGNYVVALGEIYDPFNRRGIIFRGGRR